ncbi:MAG: tetratricopeptide repeat protein [Sphaerospermopsis kisseleviana]
MMLSPILKVQNLETTSTEITSIWLAANVYLRLGRINQSLMVAHLATQKDAAQQQRYQSFCIKAIRLGAEFFEEIGNYHYAEQYWQQLTKYTPNESEAWYGLAVARANLGHFKEAADAANQVLVLNPQHQKVRSLLIELQQ